MFTFSLRGRIQKVYQLQTDPGITKITVIPDPDASVKLRKERNEKLAPLDLYVATPLLDGLPLNPHVAIEGRGFYAMHKAQTGDGRPFWAKDLRMNVDRLHLTSGASVAKAG